MDSTSPEKRQEVAASSEKAALIVQQPQKLESLLGTIDLIESFSERIGEDRSGGIGPAGTGAIAAAGGTQTQVSWRDQAISNLPDQRTMQKEIEKHIEQEMQQLKKQVRQASRVSKPGSAYKLNGLYARMRRLNGLLHEILESSYEVLKRIFIRVIIDKQNIT